MSPEFVRKYMETAKVFGQVKNACKSRQIGTIIVNPTTNCIIGAGYNSPPRGVPHCDSREYIERYFLPKINSNPEYKQALIDRGYWNGGWDTYRLQQEFCTTCPRKVMGFQAGEASEICTCAHSEQNAIANKQQDAHNCYMFAYCCVPCRDCAKMIVNAGISRVYVADETVYHYDTLEFFRDAKVSLYLYEDIPNPVVTKIGLFR